MPYRASSLPCEETEMESCKKEPVKRAHSESPVGMVKKTSTASSKAGTGDKRSQYVLRRRKSATKEASATSLGQEKEIHSGYLSKREHTMLPMSQSMLVKTIKVLATKKRDFFRMRNNFIAQQKEFLEQYSSLRRLEERAGIKESTLGQARLVAVDTWKAHDLLLLVADERDVPICTELEGDFAPMVLQELQLTVDSIRNDLLSLCSELMSSRDKLIGDMRVDHRCDKTKYKSKSDWKLKITKLDAETEELRSLFYSATSTVEKKITNLVEIAKTPWIDRHKWFVKIEAIEREKLQLELRIDELTRKLDESTDWELGCKNSSLDFQNLSKELAKERSAREMLKEALSSAEGMLRNTRARMAELKKQLKETQTELDSANRKLKDQDVLYRHQQNHLDAKSKKMKEVSKSGEKAFEALVQQRDALEMRVKELLDQLKQANQDSDLKSSELRAKFDSLQSKFAEQEKLRAVIEGKAFDYQKRASNLEKNLQEMRERSAQLVHLQESQCLNCVPTKENEPSEGEVEIYKDLIQLRSALSQAEKDLQECRADKENFLITLNKIAQEKEDARHDRLATELLTREKKILDMQRIIDECGQNENAMRQKQKQYEKELSLLRLEVAKLRNFDYFYKPVAIQDHHHMLTDAYMQVENLRKERLELVSAAASRALMLERHERAASLFCRMTRARRELAACLKCKDEPHIEPACSDISSSLTYICSNAVDTWSALKAERARSIQLQGTILAQNLQMKRDAEVRVQLEQIRTVLEKNIQHLLPMSSKIGLGTLSKSNGLISTFSQN